jgi:hypothetical protein
MMKPSPFYINDLPALRDKLLRAENEQTLMGRVWASVRRRARAAPERFPWFTPFVAVITGDGKDLEAARQAIRNYVATLDAIQCSLGVQFHFWCYAFPHARWTLYFQWLEAIGAWEPAEADRLRGELIRFQFVNFFFGLRTKPEPECVDNQTMSLAFSNALVGQLYGKGPHASALAQRMCEGSTYMDAVVGPSVPFIVELLEQAEGGDWFSRPLASNGGSAEAIVRMIAREWTPTGLTLPWDHYGYSLPVRSCIAYGARRSGDPFFLSLLERHANWAFDTMVGWGYDDLVWALIWWPAHAGPLPAQAYRSWAEPQVGAALVSDDSALYLMQMWDRSEPGFPIRQHVNPNAVVLCAYGSPLTVDGTPTKECTHFNYEGAWKDRTGVTSFGTSRTSFGPGCAGAHGVILVDGRESLRAESDYEQARLLAFDEAGKAVSTDVTPLYREHWPDTQMVRRRSRLCAERFWLIEDLAVFEQEHDVTARWFLRPEQAATDRGVMIETAEGVRLHLLPLLGPDRKTTRRIDGYPDRLDGASVQVDFTQRGREVRWLWLAWPEPTRTVALDLSEHWEVRADGGDATWRLPFTMPVFLLADLPVQRRWWYRRTFRAPEAGPCWLRLPVGMREPLLWINGREIDLTPQHLRMSLVPPQVALPELEPGREVEVSVRVDCSTTQHSDDPSGASCFCGLPALMAACPDESPSQAVFRDGRVRIQAGARTWELEHQLMEKR